MSFRLKSIILLPLIFLSAYADLAEHHDQNYLLIVLAVLIGGASISYVIRKIGLPNVVGELGLGMLIAVLAHYNLSWWSDVIHNRTIEMFAELGSIFLLFEIGLESNLRDLVQVGKHGIIVAIIGIILPFVGGVLVGKFLFGMGNLELELFLGAALAATSTGVSVRVFKDLGILRNPACQIVLAASIIDDILGLIILAVVSGLVISGAVNLLSIGHIFLNVIIFFLVALLLARRCTPWFIQILLKISNEESMVVTLSVAFCLFWAWFSHAIGLAAVIGAFVSGLILDEIMFRNTKHPSWYNKLMEISKKSDNQDTQQLINEQIIVGYQRNRLIDLLKPLNYFFVPIFFVYAGMQVDLIAVASWETLFNGVVLTLVAVIGKVLCGALLPKTINRWIVGFGMVPRGEIGLIFALTGQQLGIFNSQSFAAVLLMIVLTSLITPMALQAIAKKAVVL